MAWNGVFDLGGAFGEESLGGRERQIVTECREEIK
jgi:hypothetical protein